MSRPYFREVPNFNYVNLDSNVSSEFIQMKNLFKRAKIRDDILDNVRFFNKYSIVGDERPDQVALKFYNDEKFDWLVLLSNNIINIRDEWPLDNDSFMNYLVAKYENEAGYSAVHHYETLEYKDNNGIIVLPKGLKVSEGYQFKYYDSFLEQIVTVNNISQPVTNYEYELEEQEKKRDIFILKPEYLGVVLNDLKKLMKYKEGTEQFVSSTLKQANNIKLYD